MRRSDEAIKRPSDGGKKHAVIIGGGPAGSSAAFHLARSGWGVTAIEAKAFPRAKVCGEFISPAATEILESMLSPRVLQDAGARRVTDLILECGKRAIRWTMPMMDSRGAWVLSRRSLDEQLLNAATDAGARVVQPARVRGVEYFDDRVEIEVDGPGGRQTLVSDLVVHADGVGRFDGGPNTPMRRGAVGLKCHLRLPPELRSGALHMRACRGAYVGMVGVEDGRSTLALVARKRLVSLFSGDSDAMLRSLWPEYEASWREGEWLACGVAGSGFVKPEHARSFRVGNAAAAVEPVGGEGIGLALWSGRELSLALASDQAIKRTSEQGLMVHAQRQYRDAYRARLGWRRPACRTAAGVLMRPGVIRTIWPMLGAPGTRDLVLRPWYRMTGKPGAA